MRQQAQNTYKVARIIRASARISIHDADSIDVGQDLVDVEETQHHHNVYPGARTETRFLYDAVFVYIMSCGDTRYGRDVSKLAVG